MNDEIEVDGKKQINVITRRIVMSEDVGKGVTFNRTDLYWSFIVTARELSNHKPGHITTFRAIIIVTLPSTREKLTLSP
jgi:hypothetical protein